MDPSDGETAGSGADKIKEIKNVNLSQNAVDKAYDKRYNSNIIEKDKAVKRTSSIKETETESCRQVKGA